MIMIAFFIVIEYEELNKNQSVEFLLFGSLSKWYMKNKENLPQTLIYGDRIDINGWVGGLGVVK